MSCIHTGHPIYHWGKFFSLLICQPALRNPTLGVYSQRWFSPQAETALALWARLHSPGAVSLHVRVLWLPHVWVSSLASGLTYMACVFIFHTLLFLFGSFSPVNPCGPFLSQLPDGRVLFPLNPQLGSKLTFVCNKGWVYEGLMCWTLKLSLSFSEVWEGWYGEENFWHCI